MYALPSQAQGNHTSTPCRKKLSMVYIQNMNVTGGKMERNGPEKILEPLCLGASFLRYRRTPQTRWQKFKSAFSYKTVLYCVEDRNDVRPLKLKQRIRAFQLWTKMTEKRIFVMMFVTSIIVIHIVCSWRCNILSPRCWRQKAPGEKIHFFSRPFIRLHKIVKIRNIFAYILILFFNHFLEQIE